MAYQETEKTMARKAAQRGRYAAAAIGIIAKQGWTSLTAAAVVRRSGGSMGSLYNLFPDMAELLAHVEAAIMHRDREAIEKAAADGSKDGAVVDAIGVLFDIFASKAISREMMSHSEAYRETITRSLSHIIGASGLAHRNEARDCARAALGAIFGMAAGSAPRGVRLSRAVLFVLRGMGVSEKKAMELAS